MKAIKICGDIWANASRDKRELSVLKELGYEVSVVAKGDKNDRGREDLVDGYRVLRYTTRPLGEGKLAIFIGRIVSLLIWSRGVSQISPDIISGENLTGTLIGLLSNVGKPKYKRAKLIYDSHEFEIGRNIKRNKFQIWWVTHLERFLIKRCAFSIAVNDTIANEVQKIHKLKQRPIVVRSTPENWSIDPKICQSKRQNILNRMIGVSYILMFHGNLSPGNGIEILVHVLAQYKDAGLVLMGVQSSKEVMIAVEKAAKEYNAENRILILPPVAVEDIWKYVGAADVEMMVGEPITKSYYYALPNKLFESIQSLTPIISSNLPEMKMIIDKFSIGLTCSPGNLKEINSCVNRMKTDKEFYSQCKINLKKAKLELCWENEKKMLIKAYQNIV